MTLPTFDVLVDSTARLDGLRSRPDAGLTVLALSDDERTPNEMGRAIESELNLRDVPHALARSGRLLVVVANLGDGEVWEPIVGAVARRLGSERLSAGLGRARSAPADVAASLREAEEALRHGHGERLTRFGDVELNALLTSTPRWLEFARGRMEPLLEAPAGDELLRTLRAYLASGRNAREAARALHVHRNTLLYRLRRIEGLLRVQLDDPDSLFDLDLALRVLDASAQAQAAPFTEPG